jgi:hypothetical protein
VRWHWNHARLLTDLGPHAEAEPYCEAALRWDPDLDGAREQMLLVRDHLGR